MWPAILFLLMVTSVKTHVIKESLTTTPTNEPISHTKEVNIITYIQNFKQIISEYVNNQYRLTTEELQKVTKILEDFLRKLATDLKDVMDNSEEKFEVKQVNDGIPDEKFNDIKRKVVEEFSDIKENTAEEMIYRLRVNLLETRQKLDDIIKESDRALEQYSNE